MMPAIRYKMLLSGISKSKKRKNIMEEKVQEAEEDMKKIINFVFADMKYHDLLEDVKHQEQNKES